MTDIYNKSRTSNGSVKIFGFDISPVGSVINSTNTNYNDVKINHDKSSFETLALNSSLPLLLAVIGVKTGGDK